MAKKYTFEQFARVTLFYPTVAYSPDGSQIGFISNVSGQYNFFTVPSGGKVSEAKQWTHYTDNTFRYFLWSPDGKQVVFHADQNGDEYTQIYILTLETGEIKALTNKMDARYFVGDWSHDGKLMSYSGTERQPQFMEAIVHNLETGERTFPMPMDGNYYAGEFSPDGRYLQVMESLSNTNQNIFLVDVQTGEATNVTPHEGEEIYFPASWKRDGSGFYIQTNQGREFNNLAFYSMADKRWDWVETPDHDVEQVVVGKDGRTLLLVVNVDGASKLQGRNLETGEALSLPDLPLGVVGGIALSPDCTKAAMVFARPVEATNIYEVDLKTGSTRPLGQSMAGGIDPAELIEPELIRYPTFDGRTIPAWLYRPKEASANHPVPVVLSIHGGPEAQERAQYNYSGLYQYLLSRGFAVLAPNIRGSTGYGISYQKLIHRDWGGAELKDIEHAAKYLKSLDWIDGNRICVYGGSFGGFATLSAVTRLPEHFALGVDLVGPSNLLTFVKSVPPHWKQFMRDWVGDPEEDLDLLMERSPITYVDNVRAPLLVIQGAKDPRVVQAESDQMVERIRSNGGDVRYYVDEQEGHGATRTENRLKWYQMVVDYIEEYLLDEPVTE
jgi:dipeptidyl aminopeptidase/acylaminoacyl peptidase